jgi:histidine kinase
LQLIGDVAHELRTPLATIRGTMEGLLDGVIEPDADRLGQIHQEAVRLQRLVNDLQELSRVEAGVYELKPNRVPVRRLLEAVQARLGMQFDDKGVELTLEIPSGLPAVWVDEDRIGQVLLNLAGNALQYTPTGGRVQIRAHKIGSQVEVQIQDSGIGIPAQHLEHLFTRFYRIDKSRSRAGGGSGIGLTISKHLIEAHGGRIRVESPGPGQGSLFAFTLPVGG